MIYRLLLCTLALAGSTGCVAYRHFAVPDARQTLAAPYHGAVRVTRADSTRVTLHAPVQVVGDSLFGSWRPGTSDGLVRTGLRLDELHAVEVERVDWPLTGVLNLPLAALAGFFIWCGAARCV